MYKGRCLCGAVSFEIEGSIEDIVMCHCSQCRKAQGSAYATNGLVDENNFALHGEAMLSGYESAPGNVKYFCRICGSPMLNRSSKRPGKVRIRLGTVESDIAERPRAHIFASSKANWDRITDDLPQYDGYAAK